MSGNDKKLFEVLNQSAVADGRYDVILKFAENLSFEVDAKQLSANHIHATIRARDCRGQAANSLSGNHVIDTVQHNNHIRVFNAFLCPFME